MTHNANSREAATTAELSAEVDTLTREISDCRTRFAACGHDDEEGKASLVARIARLSKQLAATKAALADTQG